MAILIFLFRVGLAAVLGVFCFILAIDQYMKVLNAVKTAEIENIQI